MTELFRGLTISHSILCKYWMVNLNNFELRNAHDCHSRESGNPGFIKLHWIPNQNNLNFVLCHTELVSASMDFRFRNKFLSHKDLRNDRSKHRLSLGVAMAKTKTPVFERGGFESYSVIQL